MRENLEKKEEKKKEMKKEKKHTSPKYHLHKLLFIQSHQLPNKDKTFPFIHCNATAINYFHVDPFTHFTANFFLP